MQQLGRLVVSLIGVELARWNTLLTSPGLDFLKVHAKPKILAQMNVCIGEFIKRK